MEGGASVDGGLTDCNVSGAVVRASIVTGGIVIVIVEGRFGGVGVGISIITACGCGSVPPSVCQRHRRRSSVNVGDTQEQRSTTSSRRGSVRGARAWP